MAKENKLELSFKLYNRRFDDFEFPFFKRWELSEKFSSLEEVEKYIKDFQKQEYVSDCYNSLKEVKEKSNGSIVYKFLIVPGHKSIAIKENHLSSYIQTKIVPQIKKK